MACSESKVIFPFWLFIAISSITCGILQIYGLYRFMSIQILLIIKKRYPKLVIAEGICAILVLLLLNPLHANLMANATNFGIHRHIFHYIEIAASIAIPPAAYLVANLEAMRLWLIYFRLNYLKHNEKWKSIIDNTHTEKDWFIRKKNTYGNPKYILPRMMIYYLFSVTVATAAWVLFHENNLSRVHQIQGISYSGSQWY